MKRILPTSAALFLVAFLVACNEAPKTETAVTPVPAASAAPPIILSLTPPGTKEKTSYNLQADGSSAFSVTGKGFAVGSTVTANGQKLQTAFGNPTWLTAKMPAELYAKAGAVAIKVINADGKESNSSDFKVDPK